MLYICKMLRYLLLCWLAGLASAEAQWNPDNDDDTVELEGVDAVLGRSAELPCNIEPSHREDRVYMVLWFRQGASKPLYRFDVRGRPVNQALLWSDLNAFGPRAYFVTGKRPAAALQLESVQLNDAGIYRCRVDFKNSPTRNFQVKLTVIVPPHQLLVFDNSGQVLNDVVGPLVEESDLLLTCEVRGGDPAPEVRWFIDDRPVSGKLEKAGPNVLVNKLSVASIKRQQLNTTFKCQASNTNLMQPAEKTVRLELFLKPTLVSLREKPTVMVADHEYSLSCEAWGSRPQAQLTWTRENVKFRRGKVELWQNESVVISKLVFTPAPEDDGHTLKCQAINPSLQAPPLDDSITLNVVYSPLVSLQLGTSLKPHQIKEGDDVYFECNVKANPKQHKISWFHNGEVVSQNVSTGVLFSTQSLVLQGVTRQNAGKYTCSATNNRGQTTSQPVQLRVQYAPVCMSGEGVMVGASLDEAVKVKCVVSADPDDVTFLWQFNNSGESFPVAPTRYASGNRTVSELVYTPSSQRDYGTLACWATNDIGRQIDPCTFHVVQAVKPGAVHNCTIRSAVNTSGDWLEVECLAGFDGGLAQTFHLEAIDTLTSKHCLNASNPEGPFFRVELATLSNGLAGTIQLILYSSNPKGRSELVVLEDVAIRDAEKRTDWNGNNERLRTGGVVVLLVGGLVTVGSVSGLVALCALRKRSQGRRHILGPISHTTKQVEITASGDDQRYVVSYQLKPEIKQPDILTRVSDEPFERSAGHGNHNGSGVTTFVSMGDCPPYNGITDNTHTQLPHNGLQTGQHSLSNSIPGPESCV